MTENPELVEQLQQRLAELSQQTTPRPETTHIRQRIARKRGNGFYRVQYSAAENGSRTLCGAEATTFDIGWGDGRLAKYLAYVSCEPCKQIRAGNAPSV